MDQQARIQSEKERLEDNKRRLSLLNPRENHEKTQEKPETSSNTRFDFIFKIVIIGDAVRANRLENITAETEFCFQTCGKTSLMKRYVDNYFHCDTLTTIGVDFNIKTFSLEDKIVKLQIW